MAVYTVTIPDAAPTADLAHVARRMISTDPVGIDPATAALTDWEAIGKWTVRLWGAALAAAIQQQAQAGVQTQIQQAQGLLAQTVINSV